MSLKIIRDMLSDQNVQILDIYDIGFILTVIRDNCLNDGVYELLNEFLDKIKEVSE